MNESPTSRFLEPVDDLLRAFFRAEMPDPFPVIKPPESGQQSKKISPGWAWASAPRLCLAATVAFMLLGYMALAAVFPKLPAVKSDGSAPVLWDGISHRQIIKHKSTQPKTVQDIRTPPKDKAIDGKPR